MGVALLAVPDLDVPGSFFAQCDFGPVDAEYARTASRSATAGGNHMAGEEAHFHEAARHILGQIELVENRFLALAHFGKGAGERRTPVVHLIETELQHDFSMPLEEREVKSLNWCRRRRTRQRYSLSRRLPNSSHTRITKSPACCDAGL